MPSSARVYNWYVSMVAAACMVLYGFDASTYNTVQNYTTWTNWFNNPGPYMIGFINTAYLIGAILAGFFVGGPLSDRFGRRVGMWVGCFVTILATFVQTFSPKGSVGCFIAGRVIIGIGQGCALTSGPIYIGEMSPPEIRGMIMSFWQMFYSVGSFICFWVGYATTKHKTLGEWQWKIVILFQLLVPIIICILVPFIPETPRWYIQNGNQIEKARKSLRSVRDTDQEVEDEILQIREAIEFEKEAIAHSYMALWKDKSVRKRLFLAFVLNAGQQLTGQGSLNTYSSKIYKKVFPSADQIALINALNATFGILFTLNATWTVDRFGRKFLFIVGGVGMGICMIIVATVQTQTPTLKGGIKSEPVGIAIVFLLFLFIFFYKPSWGATTWIWTSEVFSMNVRAQAVGMASQTQNVANTICQQFFPKFLDAKGFYAFYMFAGINFLLAIFVWFMIPETKQRSLEEIDVLFGGANHVEKGGDILQVQDARHATAGINSMDDNEINVASNPRLGGFEKEAASPPARELH